MSNVLDLGTLLVRIRADATVLEKVADGAVKRLDKLASQAAIAGTKMSLVLTAPILMAGKAVSKNIMAFDQGMTKALAIMEDKSPEIRKQMEEVAKSLSRETIHRPAELAQAYHVMAQAGFDAQQSMKSLRPIANFATGAMIDMEEATNLLAMGLSSMGMASKKPDEQLANLTRMTNVLTKGANMTTASQESLAIALNSKAAPNARTFGKSLEETVAVLMAFHKAGILNEQSGEHLGIVWRDLGKAVQKHGAEWERLKLAVYDNGKMRHTADILQDLDAKLHNLSDEEKVATLAMLGFEYRSVSAIKELLGLHDVIREFEKGITDLGDETGRIANEQMKSFTSQTKNLVARVDEATLALERDFVPIFKEVSRMVSQAIDWWKTLTDNQRSWIVTAAGIAAALGPVVVYFSLTMQAVLGLGTMFAAMALKGFRFVQFLGDLRKALRTAFDYQFYTSSRQAAQSVEDFMASFHGMQVEIYTTPHRLGTTAFVFRDVAAAATVAASALLGFTASARAASGSEAFKRIGTSAFQQFAADAYAAQPALLGYTAGVRSASAATEELLLRLTVYKTVVPQAAMVAGYLTGATLKAAEAIVIIDVAFQSANLRIGTTAATIVTVTDEIFRFGRFLGTTAGVVVDAAAEIQVMQLRIATTAFTVVQTTTALLGFTGGVGAVARAVAEMNLRIGTTAFTIVELNTTLNQATLRLGYTAEVAKATALSISQVGGAAASTALIVAGPLRTVAGGINIIDTTFTRVNPRVNAFAAGFRDLGRMMSDTAGAIRNVAARAFDGLRVMFIRATSALSMFKVELAVLTALYLPQFVSWLYNGNAEIRKFNDELERSSFLTQKLNKQLDRRTNKQIAALQMERDPAKQKAGFDEAVRAANRAVEEQKFAVENAKKELAKFDIDIFSGKPIRPGELGKDIAVQNLKDAESMLDNAQRRAEGLQDAAEAAADAQTVMRDAMANPGNGRATWLDSLTDMEKALQAANDEVAILEAGSEVMQSRVRIQHELRDLIRETYGVERDWLSEKQEDELQLLERTLKYRDLLKEQEKIMEGMKDDAKRIAEDIRTPFEKLGDELKNLQNLLQNHLIDRKTYDAAVKKAGEAAEVAIKEEDDKAKKKLKENKVKVNEISFVDSFQKDFLQIQSHNAKGPAERSAASLDSINKATQKALGVQQLSKQDLDEIRKAVSKMGPIQVRSFR